MQRICQEIEGRTILGMRFSIESMMLAKSAKRHHDVTFVIIRSQCRHDLKECNEQSEQGSEADGCPAIRSARLLVMIRDSPSRGSSRHRIRANVAMRPVRCVDHGCRPGWLPLPNRNRCAPYWPGFYFWRRHRRGVLAPGHRFEPRTLPRWRCLRH